VRGRKNREIANWKLWRRRRELRSRDSQNALFHEGLMILRWRLLWITMPAFCAIDAFAAATKLGIILCSDEWGRVIPPELRSI
jgi:hypothetical protein